MKVNPNELHMIFEKEQFTTAERESLTRVYELEQEIEKLHKQLETARRIATTKYRSKLAKIPKLLQKLNLEISNLENELLEKSRALCKKGVHLIKFTGLVYADRTFVKAGKYYSVTYCPICGEIFHALRYPSNFTPPTKVRRGVAFRTFMMPSGAVEATEELRNLCVSKKSDLVDETYKVGGSKILVEKLEAFIHEMRAGSHDEHAEHTEKIDLAQSILELIASIDCKKNEYAALQEQPRRFCELFGHDIEQTPYDHESTVICRCCGKSVNWSSVESTYKEARFADMINLAYVDHTFGGKLNQPTRVVYIKPKVDDSFWDD